MKTLEYRTEDKSEWPEGPWKSEPDKMQFTDPETGLPCLIKRNMSGALCGYVGVSEGHPSFGKNYDDLAESDVHGGLTYSNFCDDESEECHGICHVPDENEPKKVWWLGFDCAHWRDKMPGFRAFNEDSAIYRDVPYVKSECAKLARQLVVK